jgi:hypothetical protein
MIRFLRKYHKWLGLVLIGFIVLIALSGIVLNHRHFFSFIDISREILPREYQYDNWNNAAVKGAVNIGNDKVLIYGNLGVWQSDSLFKDFADFNNGFPNGIDNRKVSKVFLDSRGNLYAGTLFGLYKYDQSSKSWEPVELPVDEQRVVDIIEKNGSLLVLTRSYLLESAENKEFIKKELPPPVGYNNKTGLFKTLWVIHSGEIYGLAGQIVVDAVALLFIFLSITGLVYFFNRYRIINHIKKSKDPKRIQLSSQWNLLWHNRIGWTALVLLVITTLTGIFLRPPLLIAIARSEVQKIPYTKLANPNPWYDKLRAIRFDEVSKSYIISTSDGLYQSNTNLDIPLRRFESQPPVSVMGISVFEELSPGTYLAGSFSGLFEWQPESGRVLNRITGEPYVRKGSPGPPIGRDVIAGYIRDFKGAEVYFDYGRGAVCLPGTESFVEMPGQLVNTPMSLWNLALEVHTGRIYRFLFGDFYILVIPVSGLFILFILISGFIVWFKRHRKRKLIRSEFQG